MKSLSPPPSIGSVHSAKRSPRKALNQPQRHALKPAGEAQRARKLGRTGTRSHSRSASVYTVDLGRHNEVVLMQSLDLLGLQRDSRIAPPEADIRMMAFGFRELANLLNKGQRLPEIAKPEAPLDAVSFFHQVPVRRLRLKELGLFAREWRDSPATGSAGFACKSFGHCACSLCLPSPAPRPAS